MSCEGAVKAKDWLESKGYSIVDALAVSGHHEPYWSVMPNLVWTNDDTGLLKDPELRFDDDQLIAFAKSKGFVGTSRRP